MVAAGNTVARANRFFVSPWNPDIMYALDLDGDAVRVSEDGGDTWNEDSGLTNAVTAYGAWNFICNDDNCLLNDMAFDPSNARRRFAAGVAGVFFTADGGDHWHRLLDTRALPSRPRALLFDPITDPDDDTLFVATRGRGVLSLHPIPDDRPKFEVPIRSLKKPLQKKRWTWRWEAIPDVFEDASLDTGDGWEMQGNVRLQRESGPSGERGMALRRSHSPSRAAQEIAIPCDADRVGLTFSWMLTTDEGSEGGRAIFVELEKDGVPIVLDRIVTTQVTRGIWHRWQGDITSYGCGDATLSFSGLIDGENDIAFYVGDVGLQRGSRLRSKK